MPILKAKINGHNKKVLENTPPSKTNLCSCLKKENCPMRGACLTENLLYYTRINCDEETYRPTLCKGICQTTFKKRYVNRKKSFTAEKNKNHTKSSIEYPKLANFKKCSFCFHKKLVIVDDTEEIFSSKCAKLISQCCHGNN